MSKVRIGINGLGRIGRCLLRQLLRREGVEVVGVNDIAPGEQLAYLVQYDSVYGRWPEPVAFADGALRPGAARVPLSCEREPARLPWGDLGADVVVDCTGVFRKRAQAAAHLEAGARHVIISAPAPDADGTFVLGVNEDRFDPERHRVVSMASCTTNSLAPVARVLHERFGVERLLMSTVHAYTGGQALVDGPHKDARRGRAAALSIVPTTTGAARATALVLPDLAGRADGLSLRVPVPDGSITDITALLAREATAGDLLAALREAAGTERLRGILRVSDDPLVSADIVGDTHSAIVDGPSTMALGHLAKVLVWYDNEGGYAARLAEFASYLVTGARP